jgi:hypothetical protein
MKTRLCRLLNIRLEPFQAYFIENNCFIINS